MNRSTPLPSWRCGDRRLTFEDRPLVMGILNVTPDSFSDGGHFATREDAIRHGLRLAEEGADIIDVGGESTRPGAAPVPADEEIRRVVPVVEALARRTRAVLSVDTMKAAVARAAVDAGAGIVNDVSALAHDPALAGVAAAAGVGVVLMHMQGTPRTMQRDPTYGDVVEEVTAALAARLAAAEAAGVAREALAVDPGIGFGKTVPHNLQLLANLGRPAALGRPVVVGLSRKSFIGRLTGAAVEDRLAGSLAGLVLAALDGAHVLRVHDVAASRQALDIALAIARERRVRTAR